MSRRCFTSSLLALVACGGRATAGPVAHLEPALKDLPVDPAKVERVVRTDDEWKAALDPEAYRILRGKGTERAYTGRYWNNHDSGNYLCAGCGLLLFRSEDKFDSGTGWPSFTRPAAPDRVTDERDDSLGMARTETLCARCGGHLGHVFDDGPKPTGLRYCMNGNALVFRPA